MEATPFLSTSNPAPVSNVYLKSINTYFALSAVTGSTLVILKSWYMLSPFWEMAAMSADLKNALSFSWIFYINIYIVVA